MAPIDNPQKSLQENQESKGLDSEYENVEIEVEETQQPSPRD